METLKTRRLIIRPWTLEDVHSLYEYAKDEEVAQMGGWPVHQDLEDSLHYLETIFMRPNIFAITLKGDTELGAIGCIGLQFDEMANLDMVPNEAEVSYWLGKPFWGNGYAVEALEKVLQYGFQNLHLDKIWCSHFDSNSQSRSVQEKFGFKHKVTLVNKWNELIEEHKDVIVNCLTKTEWNNRKF